MLGLLLRVAKISTDKPRQVMVLLSIIYYTSTSIFVSVYRGDQKKIKAEVAHPPRFMILERSLKGVFTFCVVYVFTCNILPQVITVVTTEVLFAIMLTAFHACTCIAVLRLRQTLLLMSVFLGVNAALTFVKLESGYWPWYIFATTGYGVIPFLALLYFAYRLRWFRRCCC